MGRKIVEDIDLEIKEAIKEKRISEEIWELEEFNLINVANF